MLVLTEPFISFRFELYSKKREEGEKRGKEKRENMEDFVDDDPRKWANREITTRRCAAVVKTSKCMRT